MLGCTPKWSIRGSWNGTHDSPQRRQAATRWQTNTAVCILCVGGSPKLGPATTLAVPSVGRGPRIGRIRHRTHPQRRQNSKICTADDGKPSTASSEIQNLSQHRRLPPPSVAGVPSLGPATTPTNPTHKKPHLRSSNLNYFSPTTGVRFTEGSSASIAISVVAERDVHAADQ